MATHSSVFARRIPWTEEPGGLHSMGLQSRKHDRNDLARRQACSKHQLRADVEGGDPQVGEVSPCTDSHFQFPLLLEPGTRFTYVASLWRELGGVVWRRFKYIYCARSFYYYYISKELDTTEQLIPRQIIRY